MVIFVVYSPRKEVYILTTKELDGALETALNNFKSEIKLTVSDEYGKNPITEGDAVEIAKQTFYVLDDFKDKLIEYLKTN